MVLVAWIRLYRKLPGFWEFICILIHDWGYWGKDNLDGEEGEDHPRFAAELIHAITGNHYYWELCMFHSRFQAQKYRGDPSKLCLADKWGVAMLPTCVWVIMGRWTGEIEEYRSNKKYEIFQQSRKSDYAWFNDYKAICAEWVKARDLTIGRFGIPE